MPDAGAMRAEANDDITELTDDRIAAANIANTVKTVIPAWCSAGQNFCKAIALRSGIKWFSVCAGNHDSVNGYMDRGVIT